MLIIGHRGASALAPENTLAAFGRAMLDGADGIEFDVRLASDGVPVVIHDATLRRTARRAGRVAGLTAKELGEVDVGTWFNLRFPSRADADYARATVPTLAEVFEMFRDRDAQLYVEMKCAVNEGPALAAAVARFVREHDFYGRAVVESFALDSILEIKRLDPKIRTAALFEPKLTRPVRSKRALIAAALAVEADEIALHRTLATRRAVALATEHSLKTVVWTADHPSWVRRALAVGIHAVITNDPARLSAEHRRLLALSE